MNEYTRKDAIDKPYVEEENEFLLEAAIYLSNNKEQSFHQIFFSELTPNQRIVVIRRNKRLEQFTFKEYGHGDSKYLEHWYNRQSQDAYDLESARLYKLYKEEQVTSSY